MKQPYNVMLRNMRKQAVSNPPVMGLSAVWNGNLTLYIYDIVGEDFFGEGITAKRVSEVLDGETYQRMTLRINSPGGDPFEAVAILNLLKSKGKPITVIVDGLAASAASLLAMVGDEVLMGEGSMLMIHNAWTLAAGNAAELRKIADDLETISSTMRGVYVARTELSADEVQKIMDEETWLGPEDAIAKGFADGMCEPDSAQPPAATSAYRAQLERELELL